jgi:flagellar biosynthesis/type III secretory pathway chaperone
MTNLNPQASVTTESLSQIIEQHISSANQLLEILQQEHQVLLNGKAEALEQISVTKMQSVGAFQLLSDNLNRLLGSESIDKLLARISGGINLQQRWQQLLTLVHECQKNNLANGAIITERQSYVRHAIKSLFGNEAQSGVYGRYGDSNFKPERRIIASA